MPQGSSPWLFYTTALGPVVRKHVVVKAHGGGKAAYLVLARKQRQKKGLRSNGHVKRIPTVN